ncbi:MAG: hypothetical protein ABIM89_18880 [Mycobacteriales bacterium]
MTDDVERATALAQAAGKNIGSAVRRLGEVTVGGDVPARTPDAQQLADRAMAVLREEVALLSRVRTEFAEEKKHGAPAASSPRLDAMAARLEGMTRLALLLELIAPAEAREIWTEARQSGMHARPAASGAEHTGAAHESAVAHGTIEGEH